MAGIGVSKRHTRAVVEAIAKHASARIVSIAAGDVRIAVGRKKIALDLVPMKASGAYPKPRLRFDKVVTRVTRDMKAAMQDAAPDGTTVLFTLTAPIRLASKTEAAMEETARGLLARKGNRAEARTTIHGNDIRIRIERRGAAHLPKLIGFVHNRETDARILLNEVSAFLDALSQAAKPRASKSDRWLAVTNAGLPSHIEAYRVVCVEFSMPAGVRKVLLVFGDGRVEALK